MWTPSSGCTYTNHTPVVVKSQSNNNWFRIVLGDMRDYSPETYSCLCSENAGEAYGFQPPCHYTCLFSLFSGSRPFLFSLSLSIVPLLGFSLFVFVKRFLIYKVRLNCGCQVVTVTSRHFLFPLLLLVVQSAIQCMYGKIMPIHLKITNFDEPCHMSSFDWFPGKS